MSTLALDAPPLDGPTVVVTRPADQAGAWVDGLQRHGIPAVAAPLIGIAPAADLLAVDAVWAGVEALGLLVFVSPNAVAQFFARRPHGLVWPQGLRVSSPGPGTTASLRQLGVPLDQLIEPAVDAPQFDSESLWEQLRLHDWQGKRALLVRGEGGRDWLAGKLVEAGAQVTFLAAYRRGPAALTPDLAKILRRALAKPAHHLWFFSSSEAIDHLATAGLLPGEALNSALQRAAAVATHPRIAERARQAGFAEVIACRPTLDAVVACLQSRRPLHPLSAPRPVP